MSFLALPKKKKRKGGRHPELRGEAGNEEEKCGDQGVSSHFQLIVREKEKGTVLQKSGD